jgi:hypothetical protein
MGEIELLQCEKRRKASWNGPSKSIVLEMQLQQTGHADKGRQRACEFIVGQRQSSHPRVMTYFLW